MKFKLALCLIIVSFLMACGESVSEPSKASAPAPSKKTTLIDTQLKALEKAKTVEKSLQDNVDERHQEMLQQGL